MQLIIEYACVKMHVKTLIAKFYNVMQNNTFSI